VLALLGGSWLRSAGAAVGGALGRLGIRTGEDLAGVAAGVASLGDAHARMAFVHTVRAAIDPQGQRVSATDRLYLAGEVPTLIVWGARDPLIPAAHGRAAHAAIPGSRLEIFDGAGHFPHRDEPVRFTEAVADFMAETEPSAVAPERWREMLQAGHSR
jgi:pimeloyl-ACP methyl ester carboxylesterase